jgi:hypothetical protein
MIRRATVAAATPVAVSPANARPTRLVVAHVRQALQQAAAIGACSAYLLAMCAVRPVQICFTPPL